MIITTRGQWGARPRRPGVQPVPMRQREEFIVHHSDGPADQTIRAIQDWCMDSRGFLDIDYNFLVRGTTGEIYEGRGWTEVGSHAIGHNTIGLGICVVGHDELSDAAKDSIRWLYAEAVRRAGHDLRVLGHRDVDPTDCPGPVIEAWLKAGGVDRPAGKPPRELRLRRPPLTGPDVRAVQLKVGATPDGVYGPKTKAAVRAWQAAHGLVADGIVGPKTRTAMGLTA